MIRRSAHLRLARRLVAAGLAFALGVAGCGEPDRAPTPESPARPSADEPGVRELLARLRGRVEAGTGLADAAFGQDVAHLALLLWPTQPTDAVRRAVDDHVNLASVAGDVGRDLARKPEERAHWPAREAVSLEIHDAWLAAADRDPDAYRSWVEGEGAALAKRLRDERARLFERR